MVDIAGLDKVALLERLWQHMQPAGFFAEASLHAPTFDKNKAKVATRGYIDYFCGRCIKCDLSGDEADAYLYDRDTGAGTFAAIVQDMRNAM